VPLRPNINGVKVPFDKNTHELIAMLDCDLSQFHVVCEALSYKNDELSLKTLMSTLKDSDPFKRRIGVECLGNHAMFYRALDYVLACLDDKSPYVVRTAIRIMVKHRAMESHEKIIALLESKDEPTRETAVSALEHINKPSDFDILLSLQNDKNKKIRNLVPYIVLATANETNWSKAYNMMKHSDNEKTRLFACKLLYKFGTKKEKDEAKLFLQDKNGHVRKCASKMTSKNGAA
jgi:HEAT repeat protein